MPVSALVFIGAALFAAGTALAGWWAVPLLAGLWALWFRPRPILVAASGALAWGGLLGWQVIRGPVGVLARRLGAVFQVPPWVLLLTTPLFAALLALSAAALVTGLKPSPRRRGGCS